jgi:hypothetical protein
MLLVEDVETRLQACATGQTDPCGELTYIMHRCAHAAYAERATGPQVQLKRKIPRAKRGVYIENTIHLDTKRTTTASR